MFFLAEGIIYELAHSTSVFINCWRLENAKQLEKKY